MHIGELVCQVAALLRSNIFRTGRSNILSHIFLKACSWVHANVALLKMAF